MNFQKNIKLHFLPENWSKTASKLASPASKKHPDKMRQNLLPHCRRGHFLSTFKPPTPRNWKLKTAESIRVVLFKKYDQKLVKNGLNHD